MSPRRRLLAAPVVLALGIGFAAAPAAQSLDCTGGSGCLVLSTAVHLIDTVPAGSLENLAAGSVRPTEVTSSAVSAFAQAEREPGTYSVGGTLAPESARATLRIRVLHFPLDPGPGTVEPGAGLPYAPGDDELRAAWTADDLAAYSGAVVLDETARPGTLLPFRPAASGLFVVVATYPGDPVTTPGIGLHRFLHDQPRAPECAPGGTGPGGVPVEVCTG